MSDTLTAKRLEKTDDLRDISPARKYRIALETGTKIKSKDVEAAVKAQIISERKEREGKHEIYIVEGYNFFGRKITLRNASREACLRDLATLNGVPCE